MANPVQPIPTGFHSVQPYLVVNDAAREIDFYQRAFGAKENFRMAGPDGKIGHAEIKIGDSIIMLADEMPQSGTRSPRSLGGTTCGIFVYVPDVDATFKQAVSAGAKQDQPVQDQFWGDRYGRLTDPFGHSWSVATHKEDVSPEELKKRSKAAMEKMTQQHQPVGA
jgi:PhnB protein